MKSSKVIALILVLCMIISLSACQNPISMVKGLFNDDEAASSIIESDEDTNGDVQLRDTVLYYKDDKGYLIPVMRKIPWTEGIGKAALSNLIDSPTNRKDVEGIGLLPILPAATQIRGMSIDNGFCKVDFSSDILNTNSQQEEEAMVKGIVYTLTEFVTIDQVQLMVEGKKVDALTYGTQVSQPMARDNINYASAAPSGDKVVVYFEGTTNGLETYFVPVTKAVEKKDGTPVNMLDALDTLVEGPPEGSGLYSQIPKGTQVLSVDINNGIAYINLNEEVMDIVENKEVSDSIVKSFALTVKEQYQDIAGVKILVNGKETELGSVSKEEPAAVPTFANQY
ncbi:MAG: GerMN domain-containing protein [Bacillota bacterium]